MARRAVIGVMGAGDAARDEDVAAAFSLGAALAKEGWVVLSGGRNRGVMDAVSRGAKQADGLTIGIVPDSDRSSLSEAVDVGIITGMGSARNIINVLSSDVVIACGAGGAGTASEIALALKVKRPVVLFNDRAESFAFFAKVGGGLVHASDGVASTIEIVRKLLTR